ncbi:MAG: DUF3048 domain-containing protein [Anaerocolumna sp.]
MMRKFGIVCLMFLTFISFMGCSKKSEVKEDNSEVTPTAAVTTQAPTSTPTPTIVENHDNEVKSKLTGLWVPKEVGENRPYAIMLNNIKLASPQSGIEEASILYEAIVEGGITRFMGIFEELNETRIGSTRSARHYFVSIADEYDAIYVHYGETTYATKKIKSLGIDTLSGLTGIGETIFYRDSTIKAPHNAFATKAGILEGTKVKGYETKYKEGYESHFTFAEHVPMTKGEDARKLTLNFSNYTSPYFTYDENKQVYNRFQFNEKHIDYNSKEQLAFKNIIIQFVKEWDIDKNDYQTMDLEDASGEGYYISSGKKVDITWKKNESTKMMRYYDASGNELTINEGKTYIALFPNDRIADVVIKAKGE